MSELANALADLNEDKVKQLVQGMINSGADAMTIVDECRKGMEIVGERYNSKEYFLGELIMSGEIFKDAMSVVKPRLKEGQGGKPLARMVLGTAKGDIHNIGKDVAATLLTASGFEIYDLGIDVPPEAFVQKVKETGATIVGISGEMVRQYVGADAFTDDAPKGVDICKQFAAGVK
ncbi:MAG: B12-binding domain-containing protein [Chloroflexi bacterium]|nr:B12-binding domain-containing protein [Chloroflexota bacterium]